MNPTFCATEQLFSVTVFAKITSQRRSEIYYKDLNVSWEKILPTAHNLCSHRKSD